MKISRSATRSALHATAVTASLLVFAPSSFGQTDAALVPTATPNPPSPPAAASGASSLPTAAPTHVVAPPANVATSLSLAPTSQESTTPPGCSLDAIAALHREAPHFLVEVHARENPTATTGVVIEGGRVLVPHRRVLGGKWPITVYFKDGKESSAQLLYELDAGNFAVLSLDSPPPGLTPRTFVQTKPQVGMPVIGVGKPLHDEKTVAWEMRSAYLSNVIGDLMTASVDIAPGAPLLSCSGQIVGVQERKPYDVMPDPGVLGAAALAKATALPHPPKAAPRGYLGVGIMDPMLVVALRPGETGFGVRTALAEMGFAPRFYLKANIGAQWLTVPERSDYATATDVSRWRFQFEAVTGLNHRFRLGSPAEAFAHIDLSLYVGIAARTEYTNLRRVRSDMTTVAEESVNNDTDPLVGLRFGLSEPFEFHGLYQVQFDVNTPKQSIHTLGLGVKF